jgi:hypothetical protein
MSGVPRDGYADEEQKRRSDSGAPVCHWLFFSRTIATCILHRLTVVARSAPNVVFSPSRIVHLPNQEAALRAATIHRDRLIGGPQHAAERR